MIQRFLKNVILVFIVDWRELCKERNMIYSMASTLLEMIKEDGKLYRERCGGIV